MSDFDDNLFVAAGCAAQDAVLDSSSDEEGATQEPQALAEPPHPAQSLQDAYLECIRAHAALSEALKTAEAAGRRICYSASISDSRVSVESMSKCAVQEAVRQFGELMMRERAELDADEEFTRAFGKSMYELIEEGHGDHWERERYHRQDFRFRRALRRGTDVEDDHEGEQMPPPYLVDLLKLWDSLAATYSDGGLTLARRQAASTILREWQLDRQQFEVKNGKATIADRVYSEMQTYGHLRGQRTVHYNYRDQVHKLFQALEVFLSFCDETYLYPLQQIREQGGHDLVVRSGAKYAICSGMEVRTFKEEWKYTLSAALAEKLREFMATYGTAA